MATFIHGIGASENIDSSGEIVSIKGLDISSLDKDGVFNYEHKSDFPSQTVGKILKAKKIFSDADCDDDYQLHFWNKCKMPYLYVMGELFDDYSDSAREVAGRFKYDADHKNQNERAVMNFSVEGSKISKEGITVTRSIARKITITILPCNKVAVAEMVSVAPAKPKKGEVDELFKTESFEVEIFTPGPNWGLLKKEDPKKHATKLGIKPFQKDMGGGQISNTASSGLSGVGPTSSGGILAASETKMNKAASLSIVKPQQSHERGPKIGMTSSGKAVHSHGMVGDYHGFSAKDHVEAAGHHQKMASKVSGTNSAMGTHHGQKATLHMQASKSAARKIAKSEGKYTGPKMAGEKGVHQQGSATHRGTSMAGVLARTKGSKSLQADAHKRRLGELKDMPKPNLPKSEDMNKGIGSALKTAGKAIINGFAQAGASAAGQKMPPTDKPKAPPANKPKMDMTKAMEAGSGMSAPGTQSGGAALAGESMSTSSNGTFNAGGNTLFTTKKKKSSLLIRAEEQYAAWEKREAFETFMKSRMPGLTKGEIQVIGQTMLLQKSLKKDSFNPSTLLGKNKK